MVEHLGGGAAVWAGDTDRSEDALKGQAPAVACRYEAPAEPRVDEARHALALVREVAVAG